MTPRVEVIASEYLPAGTIHVMPSGGRPIDLTAEEQQRLDAASTIEGRWREIGSILAARGQFVIVNVGAQ